MRNTTVMIEPEPGAESAALSVDVQWALGDAPTISAPPTEQQLCDWAVRAYLEVPQTSDSPSETEVTIRVVGRVEITQLNRDYRGKDKPTNVLSFPFEAPEGVEIPLLGDVVVCHDVVLAEAQIEGKTVLDHYAHMVTHGILHLCGYDHQCDATADAMEALEADILALSGIQNPYLG